MSIFDRLMSTLKGGAETAATTPASTAEERKERSRFMGRDGEEPQVDPAAEDKGFEGPVMIWLHVQSTTQRLLLVPELGVAEGDELTAKMLADLHRAGLCEEVAYHAGYDQYWKMPSQDAIVRTPSLFEIPTLPLSRMKVETRLVKQGEARGFWMHVRIRAADEL